MDIYSTDDYREFMSEAMRPESGRSWGAVKKIAEVLKCHSTYVSQIIKGKSDLSTEQAIAFCRYIKLGSGETDHFLDLLNREKAGNSQTREYFQKRIDQRHADRLNLKRRLTVTEGLSLDQEVRYYNGWLPQVIHICAQTPAGETVESIARSLKLELRKVEETVNELEAIGLLETVDGKIRCLRDSVYLGKESPLISRFHANWRMRTMQEMLTSVNLKGTHYSSVLTMSAKTAKELQELIIRHLHETRELVLPSPSDHVYSFCVDFYPITDAPDINS